MNEIIKAVFPVDHGSWADALADAIMAASKEAGDVLLDARSYCDRYDYITAVALIVDGDDPGDTSAWYLGLFAEAPSVGEDAL